jgi:hypothetical protein
MASLRKQYQNLVVDNSDKPVTAAPVQAAKLPEPVTDAPKPAEQPEPESNPVEEAAQSAIKQRILETERAAELVKQRPAAEPEVPQMEDPRAQFEGAIAHLPARVQGWYRGNPQFLTDPEHAAKINYVYHAAAREVGEADTDAHLDRMEHMLFPRQAAPQPEPAPSPERPRAPAPRQQGAPVSAPPSRESHSMSTGRPVGRVSLSREEAELAKSLGITPQEYLDGKARMMREKAGGFHRDE